MISVFTYIKLPHPGDPPASGFLPFADIPMPAAATYGEYVATDFGTSVGRIIRSRDSQSQGSRVLPLVVNRYERAFSGAVNAKFDKPPQVTTLLPARNP